MTEEKSPASPAVKLIWELAAGVVAYYALFVVGPQIHDSTSERRIRLAELGDRIRDVRGRVREIRRFRSEIDEWGKDKTDA